MDFETLMGRRGSLCVMAPGLASTLAAQTYNPPAPPRANLNLDADWRFIRQDVAGAQTNGVDDSTWTALDLPHTWNNLDGQDGGNNFYRGIGWHRRHCAVDGSFLSADVSVIHWTGQRARRKPR